MFRHRLSKFGTLSLLAICLLFVGGSLQSCQDWFDDYKYDDKEPDWLGASVYDFLKEGTPGHTYNNFVAIIDSLGERETLAHTGSKTLFVADDATFEKFFENNPWGVKSVGEMTKAQMKILLYSAMLDNAMLLDMMSSTGAEVADEGTCLRRLTSASIIDTIPLVEGADMPVYNKYWDALRGTSRTETLRLAMDGTAPMMVHFLYDYLKNNSIKASDIEFLFTKNGQRTNTFTENEVMIFGSKIVDNGIHADGFSDDTLTITCKNGYIYRLDAVLLPPSNMASELRTREDTKIFSHLLDRFCVPVYDPALTAEYSAYYKSSDSIFRLRYFTKSTASNAFTSHNLLTNKTNPTVDELLNFDPGWNAFATASLAKERDMAAMFVPNDNVLFEYFANPDSAGNFLLQQFAPNMTVDNVPALLKALDNVPENIIALFLNNLMKPTFSGTVLSKFDKITDDANDVMGIKEHHVDECVIANNGVIYILNNVFGPASYQAVSAPTQVFENMMIMRNIIKQLKYDYYLLAMDARYSFIVPDDKYFVYYDPVTFTTSEPTMYAFHYNADRPDNTNKATELWAEKFSFNPNTYQITDSLGTHGPVSVTGEKFGSDAFMQNRMTDLLEYLIIVGDVESGNKYYQAKGYGTVKVDASNPDKILFYGGEQIENGTAVAVGKRYSQKNGITYCTISTTEDTEAVKGSGIPTPPTKSVYTNMKAYANAETDPFYEFYELCNPADFEELLQNTVAAGKNWTNTNKYDTLKLYSIFYNDKDGKLVNVVPFFNTYHYTVYIPSNEAIKDLYARGLPTWDEIKELSTRNPKQAASALRLMNRFLRYHFQDNSVYVDNLPFSIPAPGGGVYSEANFSTALINERTGRFYETLVKTENNTIVVKDAYVDADEKAAGEEAWAKVITTGEEGKLWNVMCRDFEFKVNNASQKIPQSITTSSFSVLQPIDRALLTDALFGYDGRFRRYAGSGELVDTMSVAGVKGSIAVSENYAPYLIAQYGNVKMAAIDGVERTMRAGYLMQPIDESNESWNSSLTRELLVKDSSNSPLLITEEGMLITQGKDADGKKIFEYVVEEGNMLKVDNAGNIIERIPVAETAN